MSVSEDVVIGIKHQQRFECLVLEENFCPALITMQNVTGLVTQVSARVGDGGSLLFLLQPRHSPHETSPAFPLEPGQPCCQAGSTHLCSTEIYFSL